MSTYKIRKVDEQNIADICTQYGSMDRIYQFLKLNNIDYSFANAITDDFITVDNTWLTPQSQFLLNNKNTVVSGDDEAYYPANDKADSLKYSKNILEDFNFTNSGDTWTLDLAFRNYGYGQANSLIYVLILTGSTVIDSYMYNLTNEYGEIVNKQIVTDLPPDNTIKVKIYSEYGDVTYLIEDEQPGVVIPPSDIAEDSGVDMGQSIAEENADFPMTHEADAGNYIVVGTGWTYSDVSYSVIYTESPSYISGNTIYLNMVDFETVMTTSNILYDLDAIWPGADLFYTNNGDTPFISRTGAMGTTFTDFNEIHYVLFISNFKYYNGQEYVYNPCSFIVQVLDNGSISIEYKYLLQYRFYEPASMGGHELYYIINSDGSETPYYSLSNIKSYKYGNYIISKLYKGDSTWRTYKRTNWWGANDVYNFPSFCIYNLQTNRFIILRDFPHKDSLGTGYDNISGSLEVKKYFLFGRYIYAVIKNYYDYYATNYGNESWYNYGKDHAVRWDITNIPNIYYDNDVAMWMYSGPTTYDMVVAGTVDAAYTTIDNKLVFESSGMTYVFAEDGSVEYGVAQTETTYDNPSNIPIGSATSSNAELSGQTSGTTSGGLTYTSSGSTVTLEGGGSWMMCESMVLTGYTVAIGDKVEVSFNYIQSKPEHDKKWKLYAVNGLDQICSNIVLLPFGDYSSSPYKAWLVLNYLADNDLKIIFKIEDGIVNGYIQITSIDVLFIEVQKIIYKDYQEKIFFT
jgi:hypothetical protein